MNSFAELHWAEGMLMQPQHLQLLQHHLEGTALALADELSPYFWGVRSLEVEEKALENQTVSIPRCAVRLPGGVEVRVPENADLPDLEIGAALDERPGDPLEVYLGLARRESQRPNLVEEGEEAGGPPRRFRVERQDVADENTGRDERPVEVRRLNARLFLRGDPALEHVLALPVVRVVQTGEVEAVPRIDPGFVPPTLELSASRKLFRLGREILNQASARSKALAEIATSSGRGLPVHSVGGPDTLLKLHVLNGFVPFFRQLLAAPRQHPLSVFCELCRFAGQLAIFGRQRRLEELPLYEHADPAPAFEAVVRAVEDLLRETYVAEALSRPFEPWREGVVAVDLEPEWLGRDRKLFIGVDGGDLERPETIRIVDQQVRIASKAEIEEVGIVAGMARIDEDRDQEPRPPSLPRRPDRVYFRLLDRPGDSTLAIVNQSGRELAFTLFVTEV